MDWMTLLHQDKRDLTLATSFFKSSHTWDEAQEFVRSLGYTVQDVTSLGHVSGTFWAWKWGQVNG